MRKNFLAFDIGATSGRSILGCVTNGRIELKELTRFPNRTIRLHNRSYWDIFALFGELKNGLRAASQLGVRPDGIGIDTWGVDFVYLGPDGSILGLPRSYRDPYTDGVPDEFFGLVPREEVYALTGVQIMNFNTIFQLYAAKKENSAALKGATRVLFMPDALAYMLTGEKFCEYTIASTSQLLNPRTGKFETRLFEAMDLSPTLMQRVVMPGEVVGRLDGAIARECGVDEIPVIAVAGHDTAAAVAAVPATDSKFAYLSSGTWSLMGIETLQPVITPRSYEMNFTNEGGVCGTNRFLKNITGMWLLEECRREWERQGQVYDYTAIVGMCDSAEAFQSFIDPDHRSFANPPSMTEAIANFCRNSGQHPPVDRAGFIRCIFDSLALKYRHVLESLRSIAPFPIEKLHVIGGGSKNRLLNQATANSTGIPVIAGPAEATAIGNLMMQAKGSGMVSSLSEIRVVVKNSFADEIFYPQNCHVWDSAYGKFIDYTNRQNL